MKLLAFPIQPHWFVMGLQDMDVLDYMELRYRICLRTDIYQGDATVLQHLAEFLEAHTLREIISKLALSWAPQESLLGVLVVELLSSLHQTRHIDA